MGKSGEATKKLQPWDRIGPAMVGETSPDPIFLEVGRALTAWELLETELSRLFAACSGLTDSMPAQRAYGTVLGSAARMQMVREAAQTAAVHRLTPYPVREIKQLLGRCGEFSHRRDDIAHGVVTQNVAAHRLQEDAIQRSWSPQLSPPPPLDVTYYLLPSPYNARLIFRPPQAPPSPGGMQAQRFMSAAQVRNEGPGEYKWDAATVRYYADEFVKLAQEARQLLSSLPT